MENANNTPNDEPQEKPEEKENGLRNQLPKFNYYWLYGALALFLLCNLMFAGSTSAAKPIIWPVFESYLLHGDVRRIVVVNEKIAEIYIENGYCQRLDV